MNTTLKTLFESIETGEIQFNRNIAVMPLFQKKERKNIYKTFGEALEDKTVEITEIIEGGSVPKLKVVNTSDYNVLLIDGEEFLGSKQNRVINVTVLIKKKSVTFIDVTCVEAGRWSYVSKSFGESKNIMASELRFERMKSVNSNILNIKKSVANQQMVWHKIDEYIERDKVNSHSSAMSDVFESRSKELDDLTNSFKIYDEQKGLIIFINGEPIGIEYVSDEKSFRRIADKIIRSYSIDAMHKDSKEKEIDKKPLETFLSAIGNSKEITHQGSGDGELLRYDDENFVASALINNDEIIHLTASFRK